MGVDNELQKCIKTNSLRIMHKKYPNVIFYHKKHQYLKYLKPGITLNYDQPKTAKLGCLKANLFSFLFQQVPWCTIERKPIGRHWKQGLWFLSTLIVLHDMVLFTFYVRHLIYELIVCELKETIIVKGLFLQHHSTT